MVTGLPSSPKLTVSCLKAVVEGSKYLEGFKIVRVSCISTDSSYLTQSAKVTPFVDFQHLEDVLVITQLKEVPADSESAD